MTKKRLNCWEYKKCGREPGGSKTAEFGVCPAATDTSFDGLNRGENAGRICWAVAGTFCGGEIQGSFADKRNSCIKCDFYKQVGTEEGKADSYTKFLNFISEDTKDSFLNQLTYKHVKAGKRFITQGSPGDEAYIIQNGTCLIIVEKNGQLHPVGHRGEGDIVGVTAILTGEPRDAHVEAETDMDLWIINPSQFDNISKEEPEMLTFLTELVATRFDSKRPVADRVIGKYIATDIIGRGGYSIVYKGVHSDLNLPVAIKMMRHDLVINPEFLTSFHNEAKIIASLNHENIIRVYDIDQRFRTVFIIMEYLEGESLRNMLRRLKTIPPMLAANFLAQICSGLGYAHERGIVHRDINTVNIFIQRNDRVKILDFGLACPAGTEDFMYGGEIIYQAPEMIEGEPPNQQTDIYALGIVAYEMVTGRKPFPDDNISTLMKMCVTQEIPDPSDIVWDLPDELREFILNACRWNPAQRYRNINDALDALQPLITGNECSVPVTPHLPKKNMTTLFLFYNDEHQQTLNRLLDDFSIKIKDSGIQLKASDFRDI